jgi:PAT family beta-lactamase induction signal transducer AmpG
MDRFEPPFLGRRRGWLVLSQLSLAAMLGVMSLANPKSDTSFFAIIAVMVAFLSASQDVVIDAYRTDVLSSKERGIGSSLAVFGYRLAMVLSGGITLIWADTQQGFGWSWSHIYSLMSLIMVGAAVMSLVFIPSVKVKMSDTTKTVAKNDILGFLSVVLAVVVGYFVSQKILLPQIKLIFEKILTLDAAGIQKWSDMTTVLIGVAITLPLAKWAAQKAKFETLNKSMSQFFSQKGALQFLFFIILYKLGDAFAGSLTTPFLIKAMSFSQAEVGVVNKVIGIWLTIAGALLGGTLMSRLGLYKSLLFFGILQLVSNFGFYWLSLVGKGAWGGFDLQPFNWVIVSLKDVSHVDHLLLSVIAVENITGGMGTAAFVSFLMALCNQKFTATQFALLSAFSAVGRVWVGPLSGILTESIGWPHFFIFSVVMGLPGLWMLYRLKQPILLLENPQLDGLLDD